MAEPVSIRYEMTISHADFLRTLPAAMQGIRHIVSGREIRAEQDGRRLSIRLSQESTRRFGPIALPVTHVEVSFEGYSDMEVQQFKTRFDNCYKRGGG